MAKKRAKAVKAKKAKKSKAKKPTQGKKGVRVASAATLAPQYCYNMTDDPDWVIRCDRDPTTGKCTSNNCVRVPASSVPMGTRLVRART